MNAQLGGSSIDLEAPASVRRHDQGHDSRLEADPRSAELLERELVESGIS